MYVDLDIDLMRRSMDGAEPTDDRKPLQHYRSKLPTRSSRLVDLMLADQLSAFPDPEDFLVGWSHFPG